MLITEKASSIKLAFDRASVRSIDKDGRLHVAKTNISKANVCPYMGSEIPNWEGLGLDPNKIYRLWRSPEELEKGASTFNNLPLLLKHIYVSAEKPEKESVVGSIGSDVVFESPYLKSSLCVWDSEAIELIDAEKLEELSCGYHYVAVMTPGTTPEGEAYDGIMTEIAGNHLALVEVGRAGSDVIVADSNPFFMKEGNTMKQTKLGRALKVALAAASPKIAEDSAFPGLVGGAVKKTFDRKGVAQKLCAMDEELSAEKIDEIIDAVLGVEESPEPEVIVKDEDDGGAKSKHAEIIDYLRSKGLDTPDLEHVGNMLTRMDRPFGGDRNPEEPKAQDDAMKPEDVDRRVDEEVKTAMDSMRREFRELEAAKHAVRKTVGDVIGMDSAESVYRFALDHLKVDHKDMPASGLATLFNVASTQAAPRVIGMDSAATKLDIPGLDRFS